MRRFIDDNGLWFLLNYFKTRIDASDSDSEALTFHLANTDIHVTWEWTTNINQAIADLVAFSYRTDIFVTPEQKGAWTQAVQTALDALAQTQYLAGIINDLNGRISQVEDGMYSDITANSFDISFGTLAGVTVTHGVWNAALHRLEC